MRALFLNFDNDTQSDLVITGDSAHHLNVVRVKIGEELLLLNGKGFALKAKIKSVNKQEVSLQVLERLSKSPTHNLSLAIANPKKEAFEDIIKMAVELGIRNIYPLKSDFSQYDYVPSERVDRIIESALIQSNNYFKPVIHPQQKLENFLLNTSVKIYFFNSLVGQTEEELRVNESENGLLLIGPEGGFKKEEIELIRNSLNSHEIHLSTPILRAPTALCTGVGFLLSKM